MRRISTYDIVWGTIILLIIMMPVSLAVQAVYWPEKDFSAEIVIPATEEKVWSYLTAPDLRTLWETGLTDILPSMGEEGKAGSRAFVLFFINGKRVEAEEKLVRVEPLAAIEKIIRYDSHAKWVHYRLDALDGTRVSYREKILYHSFADRFWAPVTLWRHDQEIQAMLERLQQRAVGG